MDASKKWLHPLGMENCH